MINPYDVVVDVIHVADMDEAYGTYVDDEYFDNHDYDDDTDDDKAWRRRDLLLAGQPVSRPAGWPWNTYLVRKKSSIPKTQDLRKKNSKWGTIVNFLGSWGVLTPTSILFFIAPFDCALQKLVYINLMQVLQKK